MTIKKGDVVQVDYTGSFDDGTVFDSSKHKGHSHPLKFEVGAKQVIPGFEKAVVGMKKGEEKNIVVEPLDAYGEYRSELVKEFPLSSIPSEEKPKIGDYIILGTPGGQQIPAKVSEVDDKMVKIDLNHPLSGKKLHFVIKIVAINTGFKEEHNHPQDPDL